MSPPSPGMPARKVRRVVVPGGRPETQISSPSRVTALSGTGGVSRTQSLRREVGTANRRDGEFQAGTRGIGVGFGAHLAHQHADRALRVASATSGMRDCPAPAPPPPANTSTACASRSSACSASAISSMPGFPPFPALLLDDACQAASSARRGLGGVRRDCAVARSRYCFAVASPWAIRASRAVAAAGQSCFAMAAAACCSAVRRAAGVPPAGARLVRPAT